MANNNKITVQGNLTADCEIFKDKVVKCRVAVNKGKDKDPIYLGVTLFTDNVDMLDKCYEELLKGTRVEVDGAIDIQVYTDADGVKHTDTVIIADEIKAIKGSYIPLKNPKPDDKPARRERSNNGGGNKSDKKPPRERAKIEEDSTNDDCPF